MKLNQIADNAGARKVRTRVGRGIGCTKGKTCGRGVKGQKSRTGVAINGFEGGQMPIYRRLPKRGFKNPNRVEYAELTIRRLQQAITGGKLDLAQVVNAESLKAAGVVHHAFAGLRLIGVGELSAKVTIEVVGATPGAIASVEKAGGAVTVTVPVVEAPAAKA
ncbi:MAG: 50S ribosomal protein L15 [Rhodospirillaceae bacterium]|nr:50S ribosomal protein L15 [Rhodospirillaceae bacterium]